MESNDFNFNAFVEDSKQALLQPEEYFENMSTRGGIGLPIIKALIYGAIAGVFILLWSLLKLSYAGGIFSGMFGTAFGFMALLGSIIGALIGLFIGAVIILILVSIAGGKTDFEPILHVTAALMVITPVSAFMSVFSAVHPILGMLITLALNLYMLWMLFNAMTRTLAARVETSKVIMYVLGGLLILFFLIGMATRRASRSFMRDFDRYDYSDKLHERANSGGDKATFTGFNKLYNRPS